MKVADGFRRHTSTTPPRSQPAETIERRNVLTTKLKFTLAGLAGAAVIAGALLLGAGIGNASDTPVKRGDSCTQIGQERKDRSGDVYICMQKSGDTCPRFHAKHPGHGGAPLPPCVCPSKSPSASPSTSLSVSASPSKSPSASASPSLSASASPQPSKTPSKPAPSTTPVAAQLPVTGADDTVVYIGMAGASMVVGGICLLIALARRNRRNA